MSLRKEVSGSKKAKTLLRSINMAPKKDVTVSFLVIEPKMTKF